MQSTKGLAGTIATALVAPIVCLCGLCIAHDVATAQSVKPTDQTARFIVMDSGRVRSETFRYWLPVPAAMRVDTLARSIFERAPATSRAWSWAFYIPEPPGTWSPDHEWQHMMITAVKGLGITEDSWRNQFAPSILARARAQAPGGKVLEDSVRYRKGPSDTAEYRLTIHYFAKNEFINWRCLAAQAGPHQSTNVCVQTGAPTVEALAATREGLVLLPPQE